MCKSVRVGNCHNLHFIIARSYELAEEKGWLGRSALNNPQK